MSSCLCGPFRRSAFGCALYVFVVACRGGTPPHATSPASGVDWFVDRAQESGLTFTHTNGMTGSFYLPEVIGPGVAIFDSDDDGDLDVYVVQGDVERGKGKGGGRLFRNDLSTTERRQGVSADGGTLRFTDVTEAAGIDARGYGMGAAAADYNNDGCIDLYLTNVGANQLYRNNCDGTFTDVTRESRTAEPGWSVSAAFVDFDRDGWLDLYVGHYVTYSAAANIACYSLAGQLDYCQPYVYPAEPSHLLRNNRDGTFSDVTAQAGMARDAGPALGVLTADFNGDGWMDIYVANDGAPNNLWINQRNGTFRNTALLAGAAVSPEGLAKASMGLDAGDFDADGDEDIFITELTGQGADLYVNDGSGVFTEESARFGLRTPTLPLTGFGTAWFDFDNDGWLDLAAVNGAVTHTAEALARRERFSLQQKKQLFRSVPSSGDRRAGFDGRPRHFEDVTAQAGSVFQTEDVGRGAAFGDIDNDGDTDIVVANANGPLRLLINTVGDQKKWVGVRVLTGRRDALGARVAVILADGSVLWRRARSDGSYGSANDARVLVGLGDDSRPVRVRVHWPDGAAEEWADVAPGAYITLAQGGGVVSR